jgi:hypothetical protein
MALFLMCADTISVASPSSSGRSAIDSSRMSVGN